MGSDEFLHAILTVVTRGEARTIRDVSVLDSITRMNLRVGPAIGITVFDTLDVDDNDLVVRRLVRKVRESKRSLIIRENLATIVIMFHEFTLQEFLDVHQFTLTLH